MLFPGSMGQGTSSGSMPLTWLLQDVSLAGQKALSSKHPLLNKYEKSQDRSAQPLWMSWAYTALLWSKAPDSMDYRFLIHTGGIERDCSCNGYSAYLLAYDHRIGMPLHLLTTGPHWFLI